MAGLTQGPGRTGMAPMIGCRTCSLAGVPSDALRSIEAFKLCHGRAWSGDLLIEQGERERKLFTLFSGWAIQFKMLDGGERQIVHVLLPGDLIGLETCTLGVAEFTVQAVTDTTYCVFNAQRLQDVMVEANLAERLLKILSQQISRMGERMSVIGACEAKRNVAHFVAVLHERLLRIGLAQDRSFRIPLSIQQIADCCGLTSVHIHRVLRTLREEGVLHIDNHRVEILNDVALADAAHLLPRSLPQDVVL